MSDSLWGALTGVAAVLAMTAVAAAGLAQTGLGLAVLPEALALAVGATAEIGGRGLPMLVDGMPLGVSLSGAAVLALLLPRGLGPAVSRSASVHIVPASHATRGGVTSQASHATRGGITSPASHTTRGGITSQASPASVRGFASRVGGAVAGFVVALAIFSPPLPALGTGAAWVVAVLGLTWLGSRRAPLPAVVARWVRPALSAACAVLLTLAAVTVAGGQVVAAVNGPVGGGIMLAGPNLLAAVLSSGSGATWTMSAPPRLGGDFLPGLGVTALALAAVVMVIAVTAARRSDGPARLAGGMAVVGGAVPAVLTWLAGVSISLGPLSFGAAGRLAPLSVPAVAALGALAGLGASLVRDRKDS